MLHLSPQGGAKLLGSEQWGEARRVTRAERPRGLQVAGAKFVGHRRAGFQSDLLRIFLFTNLWTSQARLHFNEVLWRSTFAGFGARSCTWQACCSVIKASFCAGVWEPDPLTCVAALKAEPQNSHGGPARVGGTLHC